MNSISTSVRSLSPSSAPSRWRKCSSSCGRKNAEERQYKKRQSIGLSKDYHLHTWRHFFITSLLHSGVDKQTVADLAGHGDTSFLERTYCHPQLERKREASSCLFTQVFGPVTYSGDPADEAGEEPAEKSDNPLTA